MEVALPDTELFDVELTPRMRDLKGVSARPPNLRRRLSIGVPQHLALSTSQEFLDAELREYLKVNANTTSYYLVQLTCTFVDDDGEPFDSGWLTIDLQTGSVPDAPRPVARSMEPLMLFDGLEVSRTAKFGASMKLVAEVGAGQKYAKKQVTTQALDEGTSRPSWEFFRTKASRMQGVQRLRLIVEAPVAATIHGEIELGASVKLRSLGIASFTVPYDDAPELLSFNLSAATPGQSSTSN